MQFVDGVLDFIQLTVRPIETFKGCSVRPVLGDVGTGQVEELYEEFAGEERQAAALRETDLGHFARDDDLVGPVGSGADNGDRLGRRLRHTG